MPPGIRSSWFANPGKDAKRYTWGPGATQLTAKPLGFELSGFADGELIVQRPSVFVRNFLRPHQAHSRSECLLAYCLAFHRRYAAQAARVQPSQTLPSSIICSNSLTGTLS